MSVPILLASGSAIRAQLLENAGVPFTVQTARVDEDTAKRALLAENASPRDIADTLAEMKARKVSDKNPGAMVLGCDQVLDFDGQLLSKPETPEQAVAQLKEMRGKRHMLLSAAVIYQDGEPIWRHIGQVRLRMRASSDAYLKDYVSRNWDSIRHAVGAYKLEEEGVRLFATIDGDYFNVLGMPLLELLNFLAVKGVIDQ
ncbi:MULTISPECIES: nucleoside triphosphate pyrophosphatase [unclassified Ruegeria]|uniref:Maf family protein n=1 Tax=unclassified Ruegeria TaxID=2625375 RepID=UPI0014896B83|nr:MULTISPECIES: nucleoside triphosphate pyrophosphatase [unclassified Ruegeria]NOD76060.1 septum formation protein Maf [Ruegeria sp. HKCCD4332]